MNNCLEKYMVDKNKIQKKAVINYWVRLFPERKDAAEVEKIVEEISSKKLEDYWEKYEKENQVLFEIEVFFEELEKDSFYKKESERLYEKLSKTDRWAKFYIPLLYREMKRFEEVLEASAIVENPERVSDAVAEDIVRKLGGECYRVLVGEIGVAGEEKRLQGASPEERGEFFCTHLLEQTEYQKELYLSYPELFRIMNQTIQNNIDYSIEIVKNTEKEFEHIKNKLGKEKKLGKLEKIRLGTGDSHNKGKTVAGLVFSDGQKIMYKPRDFQMEESYSHFVDWLNGAVEDISPLGYCRTHSMERAGWVEFVENEPCDSLEEAREFYTKMGELLCILYTLNARDFHCENVIARRNVPMLIDLETLIHVDEMEEVKEPEAVEEKILEIINQSVYTTALLPTLLQNFNTNDVMEVGAIASGRKRKSPFKVHVIKDSASDNATLEQVYREIPDNQNMPLFQGKQINGSDYFLEVKEAFIKMYRWILKHKEEYIFHVRQIFDNVECRIIYKPTNNYSQLLNTSYHPGLLHNQVDREIYFHRLGLLLDGTDPLEQSDVYKDEIRAMMQGDVPVYYMYSNGTSVYNGKGKSVYDGYIKTPLDRIKDKVDQMDELDLKRQIAFIYFSYLGCKMPTDIEERTKTTFQLDESEKEMISCVEYVKEAEVLAEEIKNRAVTATIKGQEQISWIGYQGIGDNGFAMTSVGWDIYKGNCGQGLYFMKLAMTTGKAEYMEDVRKILSSVETTFDGLTREEYEMVGNGAFTGSAGYIYLCTEMFRKKLCTLEEMENKFRIIGKLLEHMELQLEKNDELDVLSGCAGTLGVLVSFYPYARGENFLRTKRLIQKITDLLLEKAKFRDGKKITWTENGDIGYAHGNAGIMAQLARANRILENDKIRKAIDMALRYEREERFDQEKERWKLRGNAHYFSWCNGIGGILLSKIIMKEAGVQDKKLDREILKLMDQLKECGFGNDTCICHGDMGTLCILKKAAKFVGDEKTWKECRRTTDDFMKKELYEKGDHLFRLENWGVMTGIAGIGLGLLEQATEDSYLISLLSLD